MEKIMKIAICLSGQPRTWNTCYPTWFKLIEKIKQVYDVETVDFFCHFWDYNSSPHGLLLKQGLDHHNVNGIKLSDEEKQHIIDVVKPVSYIFDNETTNKSRIEFIKDQNSTKYIHIYGRTPLHWCASQFYSVMYASYLKRKYELLNNLSYDMCIRLRCDLYLQDNEINSFIRNDLYRPEENTVYVCHAAKDSSFFPMHRVGDIFWYSDSITFNKICEYYRWLPMLGSKVLGTDSYEISTEHALYLYMKMLSIDLKPLTVDPKIFRGPEYLSAMLLLDKNSRLGQHELV